MSIDADFYAVLGVLPDAEHVVIVAAYRALASLYHPDKWKGDVAAATRRMAEINVAYGVLSDVEKRKAYDATRAPSRSTFAESDEESDNAFDQAMSEVEDRWQTAVEIFPDLAVIRKRLNLVAHRLAFAFVTVMLETMRFNERIEIALAMENNFLQRYFGTDPSILIYVKKLISDGQREAVKAVNRYVDVLGSDVPASVIINKVDTRFNLKSETSIAAQKFKSALASGEYNAAANAGFTWLTANGYTFNTSPSGIRVMKGPDEIGFFTTESFISWLLMQNI